MTDAYEQFLASKRRRVHQIGPPCEPDDIKPTLHEWQRHITSWAVRTGRAGIFADCGLGKTFMQLEWCNQIGGTTLIVAPLSVARQTVRESAKLDIDVRYVRHGDDVTHDGIWITNYEMLDQSPSNSAKNAARRNAP